MGISRLCIAEWDGRRARGVGLGMALLGLVCLVGGCATFGISVPEKSPVSYGSAVRESPDGFVFCVSNPGQVVVYDATAKHTLFTRDVKPGDCVNLSVAEQRIVFNDQKIHVPTVAGNVYQLFWVDTFARPPQYTN